MFSLPSLPPITAPVALPSGDAGHLDAATGDVFNQAGEWLGNLNKTALANMPSSPATASSPAAAGKPASSGAGALTALVTLEKWAAGLVSRSSEPNTGLSLEDIVFIVLGLLMLAGALFTFKETKTTVQNITRSARGAVDKVASTKLAELAA
jgi:LPXTG-motif cell wall-anchored protein